MTQDTAHPAPQRIGVLRETFPREKRVATVPDVVEKLRQLGFAVAIETGAGDAANFSDDTYRAVGAEVLPSAAAVWQAAVIVFKSSPSMRWNFCVTGAGGRTLKSARRRCHCPASSLGMP